MTTSLTDSFPEGLGSEWSRAEAYVKDSRPIWQVKKLDLKGAVDVVFYRDDVPRLVVAAETKETVGRVRTSITGDKLTIEQEGNVIICGDGNIHVSGSGNVVVGRNLNVGGVHIQFNGSVGSIDVGNSCISSTRALVAISLPHAPRVRLKGSGDITLYGLQQEELEVSISGSGNVTLNGVVQSLEVDVAGSGDVDARDLAAAYVDLSIAGSGDITAQASQSARARVLGSGDIVVCGNPPQRDHRVTGSGKIKFK
ncbi:TPA: DUF2807 domain-containing protein [Pseudomonas aeruginosa]